MVVKIAKENVDDGTITEVVDGTVIAATSIAELDEHGPRPDVIKTHFCCTQCGEEFRLFCETYHGSGGAWTYGERS